MPRGIAGNYAIEGFRFHNMRAAFTYAKTMGFNGCKATIENRLRAGVKTLAELVAPVSEARSESGKVKAAITATSNARRRSEMAAIMAEVDARRAAIAAAVPTDSEED